MQKLKKKKFTVMKRTTRLESSIIVKSLSTLNHTDSPLPPPPSNLLVIASLKCSLIELNMLGLIPLKTQRSKIRKYFSTSMFTNNYLNSTGRSY